MHFEVRTRTVLTPAARDASRANVSRIIIYYNLRAPEKKEKQKTKPACPSGCVAVHNNNNT